jgi:hypothetical protein
VVLGFDSRRGLGILLFTTTSRTDLRPTQPPIQWVPEALSLGVKRPEREADNSAPSSAEVKSAYSYTSTPLYVFMAWCLVRHRDNFFTFIFICLLILSCLYNRNHDFYHGISCARNFVSVHFKIIIIIFFFFIFQGLDLLACSVSEFIF